MRRGLLSGVLAGIALLVFAMPVLGLRALTVRSGSMSPALHAGDVVVERSVVSTAIRVGDVVTFHDPGRGVLVTHRVRAVRSGGVGVEVVTRGDANTGTERWTMARDGRLGRVVARVPRVGAVLAWTTAPVARVALFVVPSLILLAMALLAIWRPHAAVSRR